MQLIPIAYPNMSWQRNPWPILTATHQSMLIYPQSLSAPWQFVRSIAPLKRPLPKANNIIGNPPLKPITDSPWQCPRCHYSGPRQIKAAKGKFFWERLLMTETGAIFFDCWTFRFLRKAIRDIMGTILDRTVPLNPKWVKGIQQWATPKAIYFDKYAWDYIRIYNRIKSRKTIGLLEFIQKKFVYYPISGNFDHLKDGTIFQGLAKMSSSGFTWFRAGKRTYDTYRDTHDYVKTAKTGIVEFLKWTIGTEISNLGGDLGDLLSHKQGFRIGFMVGTLFSAIFDTILEKAIND